MIVEPPRTLPVASLSPSSVRLFLQCTERWRRRYIENEWEPTSGAAVVGSAVHAAEGSNFQAKISSGEDFSAEEVQDLYADEFELRTEREEVDWRDEKPGQVKDSGAKVLAVYHRLRAPKVRPTSVERKFTIRFEGLDWSYRGYLDLEEEDGAVADLKVRGKALSQMDADSDLQATSNLLARRAEGSPAPAFRFHPLIRVQKPEARHVEPVVTHRSEEQLDAFVDRLFGVAAEMAWRAEMDVWGYAPPGSWFCSERWCGFWASCPGGGLHTIRTDAPKQEALLA